MVISKEQTKGTLQHLSNVHRIAWEFSCFTNVQTRNSCFQSDMPNIELFSQAYVLEIWGENSVQAITHMYSLYNVKGKLI